MSGRWDEIVRLTAWESRRVNVDRVTGADVLGAKGQISGAQLRARIDARKMRDEGPVSFDFFVKDSE